MEIVGTPNNGRQLGETSRLTGVNNTTTPLRCDGVLWDIPTNPVINSSLLLVLMSVVGFCGTASLLPGKLVCLDDDCDPSGLGSFTLHIILITVCSLLYLGVAGIGIYGAKQRSDKLNEVTDKRSEALENLIAAHEETKDSFTFRKDGGATVQEDDSSSQEDLVVGNTRINSSPDEPAEKGKCWPVNPFTMSFISSALKIPLGLGIGTITQLLCAPTQLGGSGYLLSGLKAGSREMWGVLAGFGIGVVVDGVVIYLNHKSTDQAISTTKVYEGDIAEFKTLTHKIETPVSDEDFI
jgi:hypothetical protein